MLEDESLIPKHGGYRNLKSFQVSQLVYDITVRFCERYIDKFSRTNDQMVQAARSGVQNIAEGSLASATSKKTELKLTQVARASLEELKLDYEDYLRQKELTTLKPDDLVLMRFKKLKVDTIEKFRMWVQDEHGRSLKGSHGQTQTNTNLKEKEHVPVSDRPCLSSDCLAANGALSLLNLACYLLDQQVKRLAEDFTNEGGFTERLYRVRKNKRMKDKGY